MARRPLAAGFSAEVDGVDVSAWHDRVAAFGDGSLYQLWQEDHARDASRLLLKHGADVVGAAEVRLYTVPMTHRGIAYVFWGPVWTPCGAVAPDPAIFRQAIRALRNEYVARRGMILRVVPRLYVEHAPECVAILADEGLAPVGSRRTRSLLLDLSADLKDVRAAFEQKWRNCLNKAERAGLGVVEGTSLELFDEFTVLHESMLRRKRLAPSADIQKHRHIQERLPERLKMGVVVARHEGAACAGAIYSAIGDTAIYLFGATSEAGMRTSASYLVQWQILTRLKDLKVTRYDLNGIDPAGNPGVYHFKRGLAGRRGVEVSFPGQFQALEASITNHSLLLVDSLRRRVRAARYRAAEASA